MIKYLFYHPKPFALGKYLRVPPSMTFCTNKQVNPPFVSEGSDSEDQKSSTQKKNYNLLPILGGCSVLLGLYSLLNESDPFYDIPISEVKNLIESMNPDVQQMLKESKYFFEWRKESSEKITQMTTQQVIERKLDFMQDKVKIQYSDGEYVGQGKKMENGKYKREGRGVVILKNGTKFEGNFVDDQVEGLLTIHHVNGDVTLKKITNGVCEMEFIVYKNGAISIQEAKGDIRNRLTINPKGGSVYFKNRIVENKSSIVFSLYSTDENPELFQTRMVLNKDGRGTIFYLDPEYNILYRGEGTIGVDGKNKGVYLIDGYGVFTYPNRNVQYVQYKENQFIRGILIGAYGGRQEVFFNQNNEKLYRRRPGY